MKEYRVEYKDADGNVLGVFTRNYPEMSDFGLDATNAKHHSLYWAAFRQWLVTDRAKAKRLRAGNKKDAPWSEAEVSKYFTTAAMPTYKEPTEGLSAEEKAEKALENLSPDALRRILAKAGISVVDSNG